MIAYLAAVAAALLYGLLVYGFMRFVAGRR